MHREPPSGDTDDSTPAPCRTCDGTGLLSTLSGARLDLDVESCPDCADFDDRGDDERHTSSDARDFEAEQDALYAQLERSAIGGGL